MSVQAILVDDARWERVHAATGGSMDACFQCGTCTASCPVLSRGGESFSARRLLRRAQLGLDGGYASAWQCTACRQCETRCPRHVGVVESIMGLRTIDFETGRAPPEAHEVLWSVLEEGNSCKAPRLERAKWAAGLGLKDARAGANVLLYVGCASSYDARLQRTARSAAGLLTAAGVDVGILGVHERCCGDAVRVNGERGFLERLVQQNAKTFGDTKAQTIVTLSPHCYDIIRNVYPRYGLGAEVLHATEYFQRLLDAGKLQPARRDPVDVAYHDPCYLGRYNHVYEAPRKLLESVPGVRLVEMSNSRSNALCCGGGGGGVWRRDDGNRLSTQRYQQAKDTRAQLLATACPYCIQNFEDDGRRLHGPRVLDVAELLAPPPGVAR